MANEVIPYIEMCRREGVSLQRGMNFRLRDNHSVILMSVRRGAPYRDRVEDDGTTIIYEGHDVPRGVNCPDPKKLDQPETTASGNVTENGKFHRAAQQFARGEAPPERVRVYEKIKEGIWSYNGVFHLVNSWFEETDIRKVFKFKLVAVEGEEDFAKPALAHPIHRRVIPTAVKLAVWDRDRGCCVKCQSREDLHFDHVIPYSKGGSSSTPENIQLLCGKHNLAKHDKIE
ncbi:MAG: HNH endonuclease [Candidatus Hydrogenedentes bacterium]|nr:HNH endonuclease [Candidatus Hydrogenedentota bacterium]